MIDDLQTLTADELCDRFLLVQQERQKMFRRMGPIYYWLQVRVSEYTPEKLTEERRKRGNHGGGFGVKTLLRERGATRSEINHGNVAAKAYALVVHGKMTEAEYAVISWEKCYEISSGNKLIQPAWNNGRRKVAEVHRVSPIAEESAEVEEVEESLDEDPRGDMDRFRRMLEVAQAALIAARGCLTDKQPAQWEQLISQSLTPLGRVRFELNEAARPALKDAA